MGKLKEETVLKNEKKHNCQTIASSLNGKNILYGTKVMKLHAGVYWLYNNLVLTLFDPEEGPFANITVNIEDLPVDEFAVDTNNFPEAGKILRQNHLAVPTDKLLHSGYCVYPVYKLTLEDFFKED